MLDFNKDWKFFLGDDTTGHLISNDESKYTTKDLPHDFGIEQPYNEEIGVGCTAFLVGGIGWYRKHFTLPDDIQNKKVFVYFDGVYNRANIYMNEKFIDFIAYGYAPTVLDVTKHITKDNLLSVKVDRTRHADSRWYAGSGIYRKVELHVFEKTYVPLYGVKVDTELDSDKTAKIKIRTTVENETTNNKAKVVSEIVDPTGKVVATLENDVVVDNNTVLTQEVDIANPILWDVFKGNLYTVNTRLMVDGKVIQEKVTRFGVRFFEFTLNKGFFINGRHEYLKGVCLHHDAGLLGVAIPKDAWRRRFEILKEAGCNAIRTSHNPASADFMDLCDEMGFLVQEEFYDEWDFPKDKRSNQWEKDVDYISRGHHEFFQEYAKVDLQNVIHRDYNRPSIVQWSIGNEIEWTYPKYNFATGYFGADAGGGYFFTPPPYSPEEIQKRCDLIPRDKYEIGDTAMKLANWTKEIDTTRPVTANCILPSASYASGYVDALDMVGFSYRRIVYERSHTSFPDKAIYGAENVGQWHEWKAVLDNDYIAGIFLWTGVDYLGEAGKRGPWPQKCSTPGLLDVAGFKKPSYHMFKTLWQDTPHTHIVTQTLEESVYDLTDGKLIDKKGKQWDKRLWLWQDVNNHYNYKDGEDVVVEVYSNCEEMTLFQNDKEISTLYLKDMPDRIYKWCIPFVAGKLVAKSKETTTELSTQGKPTDIRISLDKSEIIVDYDSVVHITAQILDDNGNVVTNSDCDVEFCYSDTARFFGVDNGSKFFVGDHFSNVIPTNEGQALMILGGKEKGEITVTAKLNGKSSNTLTIKVV